MLDVSWSRCADLDCIRGRGLPLGTRLQVRPAAAAEFGGVPAMAGRLLVDGAGVCFVPRFGFVAGTTYIGTIDGHAALTRLHRWRLDRAASTEILGIYPSAALVPRN